MVRDRAPQSLTLAKKSLGRRQLESERVETTMLRRVLLIREARG